MKTKQPLPSESGFPAGLAQPAQRALAGAGITRLAHLTQFNETQVKQLHGIGPNALALLRRALKANGLSFAAGANKRFYRDRTPPLLGRKLKEIGK